MLEYEMYIPLKGDPSRVETPKKIDVPRIWDISFIHVT
jgi:hypothetical protein